MTVEESIEDQIAEHYVSPAPVKRICTWEPRPGYPACTTPLAQSNKESLCFRHTQLERTLKTMKTFAMVKDDVADEALRSSFRKTDSEPLRLCAVMNCHAKLAPFNKTGRCSYHHTIKQGQEMKDGSIPWPKPIALLPPIEPITPIAALEPIQPETKEEEMTPVTIETTTEDPKHFRTCAVKDCEEPIGAHNSSGRCTGHFYIKRGMVMKDGSIPKPHTPLSAGMKRAEIKNAAAGTTGKKKHKPALPAPTVLPELPAAVIGDHVSLRVPMERLDAFLIKLSIEDKIRIVEREIFGGA
jgi:hypothetical protein